MAAKHALPLVLLLCLTSCSYGYDVRAELKGGKVVFTAEQSWFRERCVREIDVVAADRKDSTVAERGDDESRVGYGTYWSARVGSHCANRFPLTYGSPLNGELDDGQKQTILVSPKPLRKNVIYEVTTVTGATGYGSGRFMIEPDGRITNLN